MNRLMTTLMILFCGTAGIISPSPAQTPTKVTPESRSIPVERCREILREGLVSEEFWPAMHAAEALTLAGHGNEVLAALKARSETDDQKRCGLARERYRAGDRTQAAVLRKILNDPTSNGRTHAAESLFKIGVIGDGQALQAALTQNEDRKLKLMAAAALIRSGQREQIAIVRNHLSHNETDIRMIAAWVLGQVGSEADIARLREQGRKTRLFAPMPPISRDWLGSRKSPRY